MTSKEFISPDMLFGDSFALAKKIHDSGYRPDILLVLWRGGAPVGVVIHEFLAYKGIETRQIIVKAVSYSGIGERAELSIEGMDSVMPSISGHDKVLIVDDIFDSGETVKKVRKILLQRTQNIRVAALYMKEGHVSGPDYYLREVTGWVVFPHELMGLSQEELMKKSAYFNPA